MGRIGTHWADCWKVHLGCATAEVERLTRELGQAKAALQARESAINWGAHDIAKMKEQRKAAEARVAAAEEREQLLYEALWWYRTDDERAVAQGVLERVELRPATAAMQINLDLRLATTSPEHVEGRSK